MQFTSVPGHAQVKHQLLKSFQQGRVSHSQLFFGPEGNGSLPLALAYAQLLLCQNPGENDSCGTCRNCRQVRRLSHPDLHFSYPVARRKKDEKKKKPFLSTDLRKEWEEIMAEEVHFDLYRWLQKTQVENKQALISVHECEQIIHNMQLKTYSGGAKVMIMWMPERMNASAANKMLKILEEPPAHSVFLLVTANADLLLTTITSRCQKVFVPKYPVVEITEYISEKRALTPQAAQVIARISEGNLARALTLAGEAENYHLYVELFRDWMRLCYKAEVKPILAWVEECAGFEREKLRDFLKFCAASLGDAFHLNQGRDVMTRSLFEQAHFKLQDFAPFIHLRNTPLILEQLDSAAYEISRNVNARLVLTDISLELARKLRAKP